MLNQNKKNIKLNALKNTYEAKAWRFAISTADNDVARAISTNDKLISVEIFDPFLDEIRKKHRDEDVDWFDFTNEEVEARLSDEELADYCNFLTHLIDELEEREREKEYGLR